MHRLVWVTPRIPWVVVMRFSGVHPRDVSNSRSPEHVCAPESAKVVVVTGDEWNPVGSRISVGRTFSSVMSSILIVIRGGGWGACFSNLVPVHSMCGMAAGVSLA